MSPASASRRFRCRYSQATSSNSSPAWVVAGRGSIAMSSRVSCIRLTTDATPTTKPVPSFGSRRPLPRIRAEILRRRPRGNARAVVGRPSALPDAPSAVVRSLAADRCAALSQASSSCGAADRRRSGRRLICRVGKGALATCPPSTPDHAPWWWARFALPTLRLAIMRFMFHLSGKSLKTCPALFAKIFRLTCNPNQSHNSARLTQLRGGSRSSRTCGEMRWTRKAR